MKVYGLIGKSLDHSFSKAYFTQKFQSEGLNALYRNFELESIELFPQLLENQPDLCGLNVTIPYKTEIMPFLDSIDEEAHAIGAVNTIRVKNGKTKGYNTDVVGFRQSLKPFLAHGMERALILGTGGASRAVAHVYKSLGIDCTFVSRNPSQTGALSYEELNEYTLRFHLIIVNTSPVGTWPQVDEKPPIPYDHLTARHLLYDLVYNPDETAFMKEGKARGAIVLNGLEMLKIQAEESWKIWNS